jgi:hypothetical protein
MLPCDRSCVKLELVPLLCLYKNKLNAWCLREDKTFVHFWEGLALHLNICLEFLKPTDLCLLYNSLYFKSWRSWIRASWYICVNNQQGALYRLIYYFKSALHVSGDVFAHHQKHLTVFAVSGSVHQSYCRRQLAASWLNTTRYCKYSQVLLMMGENIARFM